MLHPNQEQQTHRYKRVHTGCAKYLHRFDELIMKPIFIYKYEKDMQKKSKEFFDLFMKQGNEIEQEFAHDKMAEKQMREDTLKMIQYNDTDGGGTEYAAKSNTQPGFSFISRQFTKTRRSIMAKKGFG